MVKSFKELHVWQRAHQLTLEIYKVTESYPKAEIYGLVSQMRRCSVSICANISEGSGKQSVLEFCRFLEISSGSLHELKYYLVLSTDLKLITDSQYKKLNEESEVIGKMLYNLNQFYKKKK